MRFPVVACGLVFACAGLRARAEIEPAVHMLVPGFTVRELPVNLPNVNNLRFAPDGRLTALGYDGRVWLLRDRDGDGLEDSAEVFWDKPALSVPVGMAWSTAGLYVSSHGKVSLLRDTDGDGRADREEIIASGWPPTDVASGGVDSTAVTLDKEGNLYFGLLVADYSNAYRLRKRKDLKPEERAWLEARGDRGGDPEEQVSLYDLHSQRGTIQKWNKSTGKLETIATGIRVPYALAFNRNGDLFNTDQEGETWMPNGNPLDELNHIVPGRNYGFPPRHDQWLPDLVSEPPVVAFGPQHESTCGLVFNEPHASLNLETWKRPTGRGVGAVPLPCAPAQGLFGPKWWEGDAFIAGESRGKIWRVRLVKTPHGYVGKEFLVARLNRLTVDLAISPKGDLYVCCHSGLPDWGTGPKGEGKIFKISYTEPKAPQPVMAWAAGPTEVRVAFDKPLDPSVTNAVLSGSSRVGGKARDPAVELDRRSSRDVFTNTATNFIEFGEYVRAGDRYEVIKPPYQVVKKQEAAPRGRLKIDAAYLDDDQQTLVLTTEPHSRPVTYALTIPGVKARRGKDQGQTVDLDYDLSGVAVLLAKRKIFMDWQPVRELARKAGMKTSDFIWNDWLPYAGVEFARLFAGPSKYFAEADRRLSTGTGYGFKVLARLNMPAADATLRVKSAAPFRLMVPGAAVMITNSIRSSDGNQFADLAVTGEVKDSFLAVSWKGGAADAAFTYFTRGDPTERPLRPEFLFSPWFVEVSEDETDAESAQGPASSRIGADNFGGDYERGRSLFVGDQLKCSTCHRLRGEGGTIGPDLSNLVSRDAASVLRDIKEPSASINPDYVAYNVLINDGDELTGFVRAQDNAFIKLLGADGKELILRPTEVKEMRVSSVSLMPTGLIDGLKEEQVRDLLTFLLNEPPKRAEADLDRLLNRQLATGDAGANRKSQIENRQLAIVLVASKQDHGPGQHDYPAWQQSWLRLLNSSPSNVTATAAWEWPTEDQFRAANAIVFYYWNHDWNPERYRQLDEYLERGGGVMLLHSATIADKDPEQLAGRIGLASQPQRTKYLHTPLDLKIVAPPDHPITVDLPRQIHFLDEPYWPMIGDPAKVDVLAVVNLEGQDWPMIWTFQKGKGRVFASILGHYTWTHDDPVFRLIALRGLAWAAGEPVGRFENLMRSGDGGKK